MYREGDVWICMEVMDISLDKFYRMCVDTKTPRPEPFIAKVALSVRASHCNTMRKYIPSRRQLPPNFKVIEGLNFMKETMNLIHRDVKPRLAPCSFRMLVNY